MNKSKTHKQDDIFAQEFRKRSEDYQLPVSDEVWNRIENDLMLVPSRRAKCIKWWYSISAVAAVIVIWVGWNGYFSGLWDPAIQPVAVFNSAPAPIGADSDADLKFFAKEQVTIAKTPQKASVVSAEQIAEIVEKNASKEETVEKTAKKSEKQEEVKLADFSNLSGSLSELWEEDTSVIKKKKKGNLSLALAYTHSGQSSSSSFSGKNYYAATFPCVMKLDTKTEPENTAVSNHHYKMPVSFGLSVRKYLSSHWALESGLVYTYLESSKTWTSRNGQSSSKDTKLHYLGVPLNVVYSFYNNQRLSVYASAGGMVEKDISATVPELQWSVAGSVGLNYRFVDHLHLFAEPKVGYYFDNQSTIKTIRQAQPWNFGLQVGLRWNL